MVSTMIKDIQGFVHVIQDSFMIFNEGLSGDVVLNVNAMQQILYWNKQ